MVVQRGFEAQPGLVVRVAVASVAEADEAADWPGPPVQDLGGLAAALLAVGEPVQGLAGRLAELAPAQRFVGTPDVMRVPRVSARQRTQRGQCLARAECAAHP